MNSIFTNALPGQNEDAHTYTLKERFEQPNEENSGNNNMNINSNNSEERHRFENTQNDEQIMPEMRQREKFKDFNDQNVIQDYSRAHYYNHSRSKTRRQCYRKTYEHSYK